MSTPINDGGPAFPFGVRVDHHDTYGGGHSIEETNEPGMTLRDWFAGQALPKLVHDWCEPDPKHYDAVALNAYKLADAMLVARNAKQRSHD